MKVVKSAMLALTVSVIPHVASAQVVGQGVEQHGPVTPGNCTKWYANGQIQDSGGTCGGGGGGVSLTATTGIVVTPSPITGTGTIGIDTAVVPQLGVGNNFNGGAGQAVGGTPGAGFPVGWLAYTGTDVNNASLVGLFPPGIVQTEATLLSTKQGTGTEIQLKLCESSDPASLTGKCVTVGEGIMLIPQNGGGSLTVGLGVPGFSAGAEPIRTYKGVGAYMPAAPAGYATYRANGTLGSPTAVTNNDVLRADVANGFDGTGMTPGSEMDTVVDAAGTVSAGRVPSDWLLYTYNPSGVKTQAIRVDMSQNANFAGNVLVNGQVQLQGISTPSVVLTDSIGRLSGGQLLGDVTSAGGVTTVAKIAALANATPLPVLVGSAGALSTGNVGGGAEQTISYQPGLLSAVNATKGVFGKFVKASTLDNMVGSAITFSCIANPTITLTNCHTDTSCATSPTAMATATVTSAGAAFDGTITSATIAAGEYLAWSITAGTCASIDISATAQIHAN